MGRFIFILALLTLAKAQTKQWTLQDSLALDKGTTINHLAVDAAGGVYWLENQMVVRKRDWDGFRKKWGKEKSFSNRIPVEKLTIENALFVVLKNSNAQLQLLDNQLVLIQDPIGFPLDSGINPLLTHIQDNNVLYAYDPIENRLLQWNYRTQRLQKVKNLFDKRKKIQIEEMLYQNREIYLRTKDTLFVYDEQFAELRSQPINGCAEVKINENKTWCLSQGGELNLIGHEPEKTKLEWSYITDFDVRGDYLVLQKDKVVYLYQFKSKPKK